MSRILVPDYFEQFRCKCGDCRRPCCDGWGINVDEHEYFTLIGIECSTRLRHKLDDAFVVEPLATPDEYASIRPNYLEQCPMLDDDGLCLLQKEKGEAVLPLVCRLYPRAIKQYGARHEMCMSCSCEETVELLMASDAPLSLHETDAELPFDGLFVYGDDPERDRIRHACIAAMSDLSIPLVKRLEVIGTFCCAKPAEAEADRREGLSALCHILTMLAHRSRSMREYSEKTLAYLDTEDKDELLRRFDAAEAHLYALLPDVEAKAGRIISNHMLYESFPYSPDCESPDTAFAAFCTAVALLKLLCVCDMADSDKLSDLADVLAGANRFIEHSDYYRVCSRLEHPHGMAVFARFAAVIAPQK